MIALAAFDRRWQAEARAMMMQSEREGLDCGVIWDPFKEPFAFRVVCWPTGAPMNLPRGCELVFQADSGPQTSLDMGGAA